MTLTRAVVLALNAWTAANKRAADDYHAREHPPTHCATHNRPHDSRRRCPACNARASKDYRNRKKTA